MDSTASKTHSFVGIDFGTTKTMVATYDAVKKFAKPLTVGRGKFEKPTSMYATEAGELLFGDDADDEGITDLLNHIRRFKMKLGKSGLAHVGRKSGTAQQLTAQFLDNLRDQLENQVIHAAVNRVILTVPAMFGSAQRHDLTAAAHQAGFTEVELLEEPVAAGIAYCDHHSDLSKQLRFIVVDWGGGTFDVAHLERFSSGEIKVHEDYVVGLDDIGGEVFDDELWGIASIALDTAGHGALDRQPRENWGRYRRDLCRAKEKLSSQASVSMTFAVADGIPAKVSLDRADFNNIISPIIQKAASFMNGLIVRANNAGCPPEFILLAGGTSRIPLIAEEMERITGVKCRQWSDGREAIALGAAIRANQLWGGSHEDEAQKKAEADKEKIAAKTQYRKLLETAWLDKNITADERIHLGKERKELGLTIEESQSLQIQVLGAHIAEVVDNCLEKDLMEAQRKGLITNEEYGYYRRAGGNSFGGRKFLDERLKMGNKPADHQCPKCGKSSGLGVTKCWSVGCGYIFPVGGNKKNENQSEQGKGGRQPNEPKKNEEDSFVEWMIAVVVFVVVIGVGVTLIIVFPPALGILFGGYLLYNSIKNSKS